MTLRPPWALYDFISLAGNGLCMADCGTCNSILAEPNSPSLLRLGLGCKELLCNECRRECSIIEAYGVDGVNISIKFRVSNPMYCMAKLPLQVGTAYHGPTPAHVTSLFKLNQELCGKDYEDSLMIDTLVVGGNENPRECRLKLYCRGIKVKEVHRLDTSTIHPHVVLGRSYSWCSIRVRRHVTIEAPWICIRRPDGRSYSLLCISNGKPCRVEISIHGVVEVEDGEMVLIDTKQCSPVKLAKAYLHGLPAALMRAVNHTKPCVWSRTGLILLGWSLAKSREGSLTLVLAVWNPFPLPRLHELRFERHIVDSAFLVHPTGVRDSLVTSYNVVKVPLAAHAVRLLVLSLRSIPPLIARR